MNTAVVRWTVLSVMALATSTAAFAQSFPSAPVRIVVPLAAGGAVDAVARAVAPGLAKELNQPVNVDNQRGGEPFGVLGTDFVAKASPDGHTLLLTSVAVHVLMPASHSGLPYDPIRSFTPVSLVAATPQVLVVTPALKVSSVQELLSRARSGPISFASAGQRSLSYWTGELFKMASGINASHIPHHSGSAPAVLTLMKGSVDYGFLDWAQLAPVLKSGTLKAIAVASDSRFELLPEIPTLQESGISGVNAQNWVAFLAPAGTPGTIVKHIRDATAQTLSTPETRSSLMRGAYRAAPSSSPEEFAAYLQSEVALWGKVVARSR